VKITALSNHKPAILSNYSRIGYSFAFAATNIPFSDIADFSKRNICEFKILQLPETFLLLRRKRKQ
jgi:hypothetical protein